MSELDRRAAPARPVPRHALQSRSGPGRMIASIIGGVLACTLVAIAAVGAVVYNTFSKALAASTVAISETDAPPPDLGAMEGGFNILLVGSDTREGQQGLGGTDDDSGGERNDVTILLHVAEDQQSAVAVGFPRDLQVPMPDCASYWGYEAKINVALNEGLDCVVDEVEGFTGLPIQFAAKITFIGVVNMTSYIGGVDVCVAGPVYDPETGLDLPAAGTYNLVGYDALAFLRSREGVGDGSDWGRVSSQQVYLSSLIRKVKDGALNDFTQVFGLAQGALSTMQMSQSLANPYTLVQMALALKNIPLNRITFVQYPSYGSDNGNAIPDTAAGDELMSYIAADQPFNLATVGRPGATEPDPTATLTPEQQQELADNSNLPTLEGVQGQTAADYTCSVPNE